VEIDCFPLLRITGMCHHVISTKRVDNHWWWHAHENLLPISSSGARYTIKQYKDAMLLPTRSANTVSYTDAIESPIRRRWCFLIFSTELVLASFVGCKICCEMTAWVWYGLFHFLQLQYVCKTFHQRNRFNLDWTWLMVSIWSLCATLSFGFRTLHLRTWWFDELIMPQSRILSQFVQ
jgi:hypothetical protein